ncbi:sugar kinase [Thalassotalea fonticola]|uniref:Sugar kinase n=1 Tax=Thalassotalea fonticola TaxID=3065649 RepID=A0ABZ0GQE8_9GAMM|nr:sugar kinase [Colwelliaceae bacterium S1-1]
MMSVKQSPKKAVTQPPKQPQRCASIGECMLELSSEQGTAFGTQVLRFGGDTLNTAIYMARQGVSVDYVTALGDDKWSDEMLIAWQAEQVGTQYIAQVPGRVPGLYAIQTFADGEREFSYWRNESPARELFEFNNSQTLWSQLMAFDYIYLSGITLSLYKPAVLDRLWSFCAEYKAQGGKLVFDSNYRPRNWPDAHIARQCFDKIARYCEIVLPTLDDEQLFDSTLTLEQCLAHYLGLGVKELVIKLGSKGCLVCSEGKSILVPTKAVAALDTTAAGDSFNGTYLSLRMKGYSAELSATHAHQVAGAVVQFPGAIIDKTSQPIFK